MFNIMKKWSPNCPPGLKKLERKGYFSFDGQYESIILNDSKRLRYFCPPLHLQDVNFDLNKGLDTFKANKPAVPDDRLDSLLRWIQKNYHEIKASPESGRWLNPNFVLRRGSAAIILKTPYNDDKWVFCASKWKGNIYLSRFDTEEQKSERKTSNPEGSVKKYEFWRRKIDCYLLSHDPNKSPDSSDASNLRQEFACVFQGYLGDHILCYNAVIRGVDSKKIFEDPLPLEDLKFVHTTVAFNHQTHRQILNFKKFRTLGWWSEYVLTGEDSIICGFRDYNGIVHSIKKYILPEIITMSQAFWNPAIATNFCNEFLKFVAATVVNDHDQTIYKFERVSDSQIRVTEESPSSEYCFLPEWYTNAETI